MTRWQRRVVLVGLWLCVALAIPSAQTNLAARLDGALRAAGIPIVGVSIGDPNNRATWKAQPSTLQAAAQPTIDAFNVNDPAYLDAELTAQVTAEMDNERLISAVVWTVIDTYSPPATIAKYQAARAKVISAYRLQPWKP